ncbi:MAG TPA: S9 family peptidase [Candidatus Acidoferrales bacterium]|nr:S9 family peptidase [Candidatus Acidoferrales bacterium]
MNKAPGFSRRSFLRESVFASAGAALMGGFSPARGLGLPPRDFYSLPENEQAASGAGPSGNLDEWIDRIFASREFAGERFGPVRWEEEGKSYTALERSESNPDASDIVRYETATGARSVLMRASELIPPGSKEPLDIEDFEWSQDRNKLLIYTNSRRVWRQNTRGDYWVLDRTAKSLHKLGGDAAPSTLMFAKFSADASQAAYVRENNIYAEDLRSGKITALTEDGSETTINGTSDWVYEEEFDVRDAFRWSPNGKKIAYFQFDTRQEKVFSMINDLGGGFREPITQIPYPEYGVYPKVTTVRIPCAGTPNAAVRIGVVDIGSGKTTWMNVTADPEKSYIPRCEWAGNSDELVMQHMNRLQNTNDVYLANANTGECRRIHQDKDEKWVDVNEDTNWLPGGKRFLWTSEQDGWRHVYTVARDGGGARQVTRGDFDVMGIAAIDPKGEWLYFYASPQNATQRYLYRTKLDGASEPERVTPADQSGTHFYDIAPNCEWAIHTHSTFDSPGTTEFIQLPEHRVARVMADNRELKEKVKVLGTQPAEFFQVDVGEGVKLDAWMIKPANFDPSRKYPILFQVYGEPAGQTALDAWGGRNALFHRAIANQGYLVASVDNRGTPAPKGRAWRKCIYGAVGVLSSKEQAAAVRAIARERSYVDGGRVAVWGWSGGGTNTLNLMFRAPDVYKVGISVAPVPEQRIYDSIYQERYMGLPQENVEGYKAGSAVNFAEGLQGKLLLMHGSGDDNVHFAGSELLVNRMIELGKSFDFMMYPNRTHGISEGAGTAVFLFKRLARHLTTYLPAGAGRSANALVRLPFTAGHRKVAAD